MDTRWDLLRGLSLSAKAACGPWLCLRIMSGFPSSIVLQTLGKKYIPSGWHTRASIIPAPPPAIVHESASYFLNLSRIEAQSTDEVYSRRGLLLAIAYLYVFGGHDFTWYGGIWKEGEFGEWFLFADLDRRTIYSRSARIQLTESRKGESCSRNSMGETEIAERVGSIQSRGNSRRYNKKSRIDSAKDWG